MAFRGWLDWRGREPECAIRGQEAASKLERLIESGAFEVHVARTFRLNQVAGAHQALEKHFLGKLVLLPNEQGDAL